MFVVHIRSVSNSRDYPKFPPIHYNNVKFRESFLAFISHLSSLFKNLYLYITLSLKSLLILLKYYQKSLI